jgi:hypothetical protein
VAKGDPAPKSLSPGLHPSGRFNLTRPLTRQPWPADLPLIAVSTDEDGTEVEALDMGVVLYSCSFAVIFLMILSQVTGRNGAGEKK